MTRPAQSAVRSVGSSRGTMAAAAAILAVVLASTVPVAPAKASGIPVGQDLVVLLHNKSVHSAPSLSASRRGRVESTRPLTGVRTILPVLRRRREKDGMVWVDVRLPGRPNSHTGWITTTQTTPSWTPWRLSVNLATRTVTVDYRGRAIRHFPAVVGKPSTPTPTGQFFIEEAVSLRAQAAGAPYALATSDRSNVLSHFDGGPGQIALHGTANLPGALGTASSHGCIRLDSADITWLAYRVGPGVPLAIDK
jgi:lipoprotein-anchoring transpeptidase ErfK/SrfK